MKLKQIGSPSSNASILSRIKPQSNSHGGCTINPTTSHALRRWDLLTALFLLFVCLVTPYEVAFLHAQDELIVVDKLADVLFWINRTVDLVFVVDMALQFFIMYPVAFQHGSYFVSNRTFIARRYFRTWFVCDLISIIPFSLAGMAIESEGVSKLRILKVVRLLRLLKLARLLRSLRLLKRWQVELALSYRKMTLISLLLSVVVATHWIACALGIMSSVQGDVCRAPDEPPGCAHTWLTAVAWEVDEQAGMDSNSAELTSFKSYTLALYVAATIVVHPHASIPQSDAERICLTVLIFIGGFLWTRVISHSITISTSLDRHNIAYNQQMDDLNSITKSLCLPKTLRLRIRAFFTDTRNHEQEKTWKDLRSKMSPSLRHEVMYHLNKDWLRRVPYLSNVSKVMIEQLTSRMESQSFALDETFGDNFKLYVLRRGVCSWAKGGAKVCVLTPGSVWGDDHLLLNAYDLLVPNTAHSLTYSEVLSLDRGGFREVCQDHPEYDKHLYRFYLFRVFIRTVLFEANRRRELEVQTRALLRRSNTSDEKLEKSDSRRISVHAQQVKAWRELAKGQEGAKDYVFPRKADRPTASGEGRPPESLAGFKLNGSDHAAPCNYEEKFKQLEMGLKEHLDKRNSVLEGRLDRLAERNAKLERMWSVISNATQENISGPALEAQLQMDERLKDRGHWSKNEDVKDNDIS